MLGPEQQPDQVLDILQYAAVACGITEALEIRLFDAPGAVSHYSKTYLGRTLKGIVEHHNAGEAITSKNDLARMGFLLKHLREIKAATPREFALFRTMLLKCKSAKEFYGVRMEIYAAASLTRAGVGWKKRESPDFEILTEQPLFLECASAHVEAGNKGGALYKIGSVIAAKGKKPYANGSTILFIDITNLMFQNAVNGIQCDREMVRAYAYDSLVTTNYGAALLFQYINDESLGFIRSGFIRVDSPSIGNSTLKFLNAAYPIRHLDPAPHYVMPQG